MTATGQNLRSIDRMPGRSHLRSDRSGCTWRHDVQRWLIHLLTRYSDAYASNQFRALQQFFRWLADEEQLADPMAGLRAPKVREKLVPVFTSEELSALEKACQGRSFGELRDAAIFKARVVRIGHEAARALDRYMRVRSRHGQAWRRELWLGMNNRGRLSTAAEYWLWHCFREAAGSGVSRGAGFASFVIMLVVRS